MAGSSFERECRGITNSYPVPVTNLHIDTDIHTHTQNKRITEAPHLHPNETKISMLLSLLFILHSILNYKMVYLVAITYLVLHVVILGTTSEVMKVHLDDTDEEVPVMGMLSKICSSFGIYTLLLAPSIWHVVLVYVPGFDSTFKLNF